MKLKALSGIMLALLIGMLPLVFNIQPATASLRVHNINTGLNYATIQGAINAPETLNGHTIFVEEGIYYENVVIAKSISLIGQNRSTTVIDGGGTGNVIDITADSVKVAGFTMRNGTNGIIIKKADYNIISGNIVTDNQNGIHLWSDCPVCNPARDNTIRNNVVKNNGVGISLVASISNDIYHNNFINNTQQVYIDTYSSANVWDDGYPSGGNYWSDYEQKYPNAGELDGSGIWNTTYVIDGNNRDNYPLMEPWSPRYKLTVISSPITGITFTINGKPQTTPYTEQLPEGFYILVMPETHGAYVWSRWLQGGDANRIKTFTMDQNTTLTGGFTIPVGGIYIPVNKLGLLAPYIGLTILLAVAFTTLVYVKKRSTLKRATKEPEMRVE